MGLPWLLRCQVEMARAEAEMERALKKSAEGRARRAEEEAAEWRAGAELAQRQVDEKRRKCDSERLMMQLKQDAEVEELARLHHAEVAQLRDKLKKVAHLSFRDNLNLNL